MLKSRIAKIKLCIRYDCLKLGHRIGLFRVKKLGLFRVIIILTKVNKHYLIDVLNVLVLQACVIAIYYLIVIHFLFLKGTCIYFFYIKT